ncbi:MAG: hypothetical protein AAGB22_10560 [Bacteroidota bacterium]
MKRKFVHTALVLVLCILLTVITQVGGVVLLCSIPLLRLLNRFVTHTWKRGAAHALAFLTSYLLATLFIVPEVAPIFGRKALPITGQQVQPLHASTWLLNRHYVRPELWDLTTQVAIALDQHHPGTKVAYLDANFPFMDGFPLLPHLSHDDGKKLDIAFLFKDPEGRPLSGQARTILGYGGYEAPAADEPDFPAQCARKGHWQYSLLGKIIPASKNDQLRFDEDRTADLINLLTARPEVGKVFLEPHLKTRLGLTSDKVRFHGCQAVRHDDHIHVQLR